MLEDLRKDVKVKIEWASQAGFGPERNLGRLECENKIIIRARSGQLETRGVDENLELGSQVIRAGAGTGRNLINPVTYTILLINSKLE